MSSRLLLLNVNTNSSITERMKNQACSVAQPSTVIDVLEPKWGVSSVESAYDAYISVVAGLDRLHVELGASPTPLNVPWDAMIWGGFGDPGSEAFQDLLGVPVFDLARSAAEVAFKLDGCYAILSTVARMTPLIRTVLGNDSVGVACSGIYTLNLSVAKVSDASPRVLMGYLEPLARQARQEGAHSLCLGSGALAGLSEQLADACGIPVIDSVTAAVSLAEAVRTEKQASATSFAPPPIKSRPGWPLFKAAK
jgi:allantoin racemase